jgi:hypothetical protein
MQWRPEVNVLTIPNPTVSALSPADPPGWTMLPPTSPCGMMADILNVQTA